MPWRTFVFWNALGGICWATSIGLAGYLGGSAAKRVIEDLGAYGFILVPIGLIAGYLFHRRHQRRLMQTLGVEAQPDGPHPAPAEPPA
jgi:membrane-associated protein